MFYSQISASLLQACKATLLASGVNDHNMNLIEVPGAFELVSGAHLLLERKEPDAVICLGCVIKGETRHDTYINHAVAQGLMRLSIEYNTPVIFGVLTTDTIDQAQARAGGGLGNKGEEAALAALKMGLLWGEK